MIAAHDQAVIFRGEESQLNQVNSNFVANGKGTIAYQASITSSEAVFGLFASGPSGSQRLVASSGDSISGLSNSFSEIILTSPTLNDGGDVAFSGAAGVSNQLSIWFDRGGPFPTRVASSGEVVPGLTGPEHFDSFSAPRINNRGDLTFWASTDQASLRGRRNVVMRRDNLVLCHTLLFGLADNTNHSD